MASRGWMFAKMAAVFVAVAAGGPALMLYITPSEEEIFQKFNPELQARNLALRDERRKNQQAFLDQLKEYSKSDKNMWVAEKEAQAKAREELVRREAEEKAFQGRISEEMRAQARAR